MTTTAPDVDGSRDVVVMRGHGIARVYSADGSTVLQEVHFHNLITDTGDLYSAQRYAGATPAPPLGMRLGTGTAAVAKNGSGAAIGTYLTASNVGFDAGFPSAVSKGAGAGARVTWQSTWAAGVATNAAISEVAIVTDDTTINGGGTAASTIARALFSPVVSKASDQPLVVTWQHDQQGV